MNEEQVKEIVRLKTEHLEKRIEQLERDLLLTKQHTTQAVQLMAEKFSGELDRVLGEYKDGFSSAAVDIVREKLAAHEERLNMEPIKIGISEEMKREIIPALNAVLREAQSNNLICK